MRKFLIMIACMALLSGCTQSNIVSPDSETRVGNPNFDIQDDIEPDWSQVSTEADEIFEDVNTYPYSRGFSFYLEPNKREIMLMWVVADEFPDNEILRYTEEMIKGFNDIVAVQDFSIDRAGADSYGGLWSRYALTFNIVPESTQDDEETWFISANYPAGSEFVLPTADQLTDDAAAEQESLDAESDTTETAE